MILLMEMKNFKREDEKVIFPFKNSSHLKKFSSQSHLVIFSSAFEKDSSHLKKSLISFLKV